MSEYKANIDTPPNIPPASAMPVEDTLPAALPSSVTPVNDEHSVAIAISVTPAEAGVQNDYVVELEAIPRLKRGSPE
jgi:hypothetical protein